MVKSGLSDFDYPRPTLVRGVQQEPTGSGFSCGCLSDMAALGGNLGTNLKYIPCDEGSTAPGCKAFNGCAGFKAPVREPTGQGGCVQCVLHPPAACTGEHGQQPGAMARITSDCDAMHSSSIKWP